MLTKEIFPVTVIADPNVQKMTQLFFHNSNGNMQINHARVCDNFNTEIIAAHIKPKKRSINSPNDKLGASIPSPPMFATKKVLIFRHYIFIRKRRKCWTSTLGKTTFIPQRYDANVTKVKEADLLFIYREHILHHQCRKYYFYDIWRVKLGHFSTCREQFFTICQGHLLANLAKLTQILRPVKSNFSFRWLFYAISGRKSSSKCQPV